MARFLPWLILIFPALELWVLIQVGKEIGALATVGLVIVSVFIGLTLLRLRSMHIVRAMQAELAAGRVPSGQIIDSFCLMAAGCLFLFPGLVSDALAVLLIIPGMRHVLFALSASAMRTRGFQAQTVHFSSTADQSGHTTWTCATYSNVPPQDNPPRGGMRGNAVVIDCEPERVTRDAGHARNGEDGARDITPDDPPTPR